jgi:hypothetical protein
MNHKSEMNLYQDIMGFGEITTLPAVGAEP